MKTLVCAALLLMASCAQAQFLDPAIIRQAGEAASTGNLRLGNVEIDNVQIGGGDTQQYIPSAREIAAEIRSQEERAKHRRAVEEYQARRARVASAVERGYNAEFRK